MGSTRSQAWTALSTRLKEQVHPEVVDRFVGRTHTQRFADNLLPGLSRDQVDALRRQLADGAGSELRPTATGKRAAHAPYSSAAFAVNVFGRWLGDESGLRIAGLGGFTEPLVVERNFATGTRCRWFRREPDRVPGGLTPPPEEKKPTPSARAA